MKKIICLLLLLCATVICNIAYAETVDVEINGKTQKLTTVDVFINGEKLESDQGAVIYEDRTMVPLRAICEALNCDVDWKEETKGINITNRVSAVSMRVGIRRLIKTSIENEDRVDEMDIDVPPMLINNRTLVPARAIAEAINAQVKWSAPIRRVDITLEYDYIDFFYNGVAGVGKNGKYGVINEKREEVVPCIFDEEVSAIDLGIYGFVDVKKGGKYGIYSVYGQEIAAPVYDSVNFGDAVFKERRDENVMSGVIMSAQKGNVMTFFNGNGEPIKLGLDSSNEYQPYKAEITYNEMDHEVGYAVKTTIRRYGYVDSQGNIVIQPKFYRAEEFKDGLAVVGFKDEATGDTLYGVINKNGETVIPFKYYMIIYAGDGIFTVSESENYFEKNGYVNSKGEVITPAIYDDTFVFSNDYALVSKDGYYGYINKKGETVIALEYEDGGFFSEDKLAPVKKGGKWGYIDAKGKTVIAFEYEDATAFSSGVAMVKKNGKWGMISASGKVVADYEYDDAEPVTEGLSAVCKSGLWGYIDISGKVVIDFRYSDARRFSEGLAAVGRNGVYGYIDKNGLEVIPLQYEKTYDFTDGKAKVTTSDDYYSIDKNGKRVNEF